MLLAATYTTLQLHPPLHHLLAQGVGDPNAVFLANAYYAEQAGDSAAQKLGGALANAAIFIAIVAALTFGLVLLFKHGVREAQPQPYCSGSAGSAGSAAAAVAGPIAGIQVDPQSPPSAYLPALQFVKVIYAYMGVAGFRCALLLLLCAPPRAHLRLLPVVLLAVAQS